MKLNHSTEFVVINRHEEILYTNTISFLYREIQCLLIFDNINLGNFLKQISPGRTVLPISMCKK